MNQINNITEYTDIVDKYRRKGCLSNDYIQQEVAKLISLGALFCDCYTNNAFFFVKKNVGLRVYYYINDITEIPHFDNYDNLVTEILFRGDYPLDEVTYLQSCGFSVNVIRDQYAAFYKDIILSTDSNHNVIIEPAQTIDIIEVACKLFNDSFDKLSGNFIDESEYLSLLNSKSILIAWDKSKKEILGALHQQKEGAINVIGHIAVFESSRGYGIGKALIDEFVERNKNVDRTDKTRYQLWVQRQNDAAVRMYQSKGFRFINKSTISLTK